MARKIRFPLKLKNGAEARTLEELKENFDLESVLGYYANGQLVTWLRNYYYDDIADKVAAIDKDSIEISKQLCETLGVEYVESELTIDEVKAKIERENLLKQLSPEQIICLATNQEELEELYKNSREEVIQTIYLAFGSFKLRSPGYGFYYEYVLLNETNPQVVEFDSGCDRNLEWFLKYANAGIAAAQYDVGEYYLFKVCNYGSLPKNNEEIEILYEAIKWLEKAVSQKYIKSYRQLAMAYTNMGFTYEEISEDVEHNRIKAIEWHKKALEIERELAEMGDVHAQYSLADEYYNGWHVEQDYAKAAEWYRKATEQGHADAQCNLGDMYAEGKGVEQDYAKAVEWYTKAAEQGDVVAQNNLGNMYNNGQGVEQDYAKAVEWYRKAAEQGHADAQCNLGVMYEKGYGVKQDFAKADEWYRKAAARKENKFSFSMEELLQAAEEECRNKVK